MGVLMGRLSSQEADQLAKGVHPSPFSVLGKHHVTSDTVVRAFLPRAHTVFLKQDDGSSTALDKIHKDGVFELVISTAVHQYRLEGDADGEHFSILDPYCYQSAIGDVDRYLLAEGNHHDLYRVLGSHITELDNTNGVVFSLWAPNASRVSVVGEFNQWDGRCVFRRT